MGLLNHKRIVEVLSELSRGREECRRQEEEEGKAYKLSFLFSSSSNYPGEAEEEEFQEESLIFIYLF